MSAPTTTAVAAVPKTAGGTSARPLITRVTILIGRRATDVVLPSAAPIETYIDDTVAALAALLDGTPKEMLGGFDFSAQGAWTFARPGVPPLKPDQSLDDAVVVDGSLLTLVSASRTERYRPLVEDVIDAIAVLDNSPEFDRSALNRFIGLAIPFVGSAITVLSVLTWCATGRHPWWPLALGIGGIVVLVGSWAALKIYHDVNLSESLLATAFPLIAAAVALGIPRPRAVNSSWPPQLAAAAAAVLLLTLVTRGGPRHRFELASFTGVTAIAATAAAIASGYGWQRWVAAAAVAFGLSVVTSAAKLTVAVARIALPPVPAPGETVEHEELLDPAMAGEADDGAETPTWQAIIASVPDSAVRLTERSKLAQQLIVGFVTAGTLVLVVGVVLLVGRGHFFVPTVVVAGLATLLCGFRSRLYAERWCAWALLAGVVAIPTGVTAKLSYWYPHIAWLLLIGLIVMSLLALAGIAAAVEVRRISPVSKRALELFDGAVVASIVPLLLWVTGVYSIVRNIQF